MKNIQNRKINKIKSIVCFVDKFEDNCVENDQKALSVQALNRLRKTMAKMKNLG
ncbi:hypothetical protein [Acinetobacter sp. ANC 5054]|uniref:hypothetical protein n=1 Tax=Acinetobacter sp. ANC 5054 TaxID=1977877 RepID=UPI00148ADE6E|nr:hypothetical protein [Acinetobacter sp. ANC 5054]